MHCTQVEGFLQRWRSKEVVSVEEFKLDESQLWKRKVPASFSQEPHPPHPAQRLASGRPAPTPGDSDEDMDFLGPADHRSHSQARLAGQGRGVSPSFRQFCYSGLGMHSHSSHSAGPSQAGTAAMVAWPTGQQQQQPTTKVQGAAVGSGASSGDGGWKKSGWRQAGTS